MRRKDILIIAIVFVVIIFATVFGMYYIINDGNIFSKVKEEIVEISENKKAYHSNGWETAIVNEIKDGAPIPVGFTYIEGDKNKGIIIENDETKEKFMWIPFEETYNARYEETELEPSSVESMNNIIKYNGFYVAIDERSIDEKFEEYVKENAKDYETYYKVKEMGYEEYKKTYQETTGEEFDIDPINNISISKETKLNNELKTSVVETHTLTEEELSCIKTYGEQIGESISVKEYKTMTLSKSSITTESREELEEKVKKYISQIDSAIEYIAKEKGLKVADIKTTIKKETKTEETDDLYGDLVDFSKNIPTNINEEYLDKFDEKTDEIYEKIKKVILEEYCSEDNELYSNVTELFKGASLQGTDNKKEINYDVVEKIIKTEKETAPLPKGFIHDESKKDYIRITNGDNLAFVWIEVEDIEKAREKLEEKIKQALRRRRCRSI